MKWLPVYDRDGKKSKYAVVSDCGRWNICRVIVNGRDTFEVWKDKRECVARYATAEEAKGWVRDLCKA